jgi:DNA repair exonuclease SbcCD ATPase subunit
MIIFKTLRLRNFLSFGDNVTELNLDSHKTSLIIGKNGSGKSSILLDSLCFVLFNKPYRKINKGALLNDLNEKNLEVEVEFTIGSNSYVVRRGIKPSIFGIYVNSELVPSEANYVDYQEYLEKNILGMNFKTFTQIVILGSRSFVPFMKLPAADRRAVIEDLLNLEVFTNMNTILKNRADAAREERLELEYEISSLSNKIALEKQKKTLLTDNAQSALDELNSEKSAINEQMIQIKLVDIPTTQRTVENTKVSLEDNRKLTQMSSKMEGYRGGINAKIAALQADIRFYEHSDNCPTCKQSIDPQFKVGTVCDKHSELDTLRDGLKKLDGYLTRTKNKIEESNEKYDTYSRANASLSGYHNQMRQLETRVAGLDQRIIKLQRQIQSYSYDDFVMMELEKTLSEHNDRLSGLLNKQEVMKAAGLVLKDNGIKARIVKQYVPIMNQLINKYLAAFDFYIQFELDETFTETIKSKRRNTFTYESFSEGERMRLDLALLLAWREIARVRNSSSCNLMIVDEVLDSSLEDNGIDLFLNLLPTLDRVNTFIISHKMDRAVDRFDRVVLVEKTKSYSRIRSE